MCTIAEKDLEKLKSKYSVQKHQISLLYKDYIEENNLWKTEKENFLKEMQKQNTTIDVNSIKLQEFDVNSLISNILNPFIQWRRAIK